MNAPFRSPGSGSTWEAEGALPPSVEGRDVGIILPETRIISSVCRDYVVVAMPRGPVVEISS